MTTREVTEGKTKIVAPISAVRLTSKPDLTASNGAKHDVLEGKAELATTTACNVFELLKYCGQPVAYYGQDSSTSFIAPACRMVLWEVIVRRKAQKGSILKRHPELPSGHIFNPLKLEFFLKTKDQKWHDFDLECDDPLAEFLPGGDILLWNPDKPQTPGTHFLRLHASEVYERPEDAQLLEQMGVLAKRTFCIVERAFALLGYELGDFKVEFGVEEHGNLLLGDVIDNDSWRLYFHGINVDKQGYRDGEPLPKVLKSYRRVAKVTERFRHVRSKVKKWTDLNCERMSA